MAMRHSARSALLFAATSLLLQLASAQSSDDLLKAVQVRDALDAAATEAAATELLAPHLGDLKRLPPEVVEKVVLRQWWTLARDIVAKSHVQQVDLSFGVRKAVRALKDESDELLRMLNPKYGQAQQVSPAFQWAQNDTAIFLTIKYTVRWNAPGALEVTEPSVNMSYNVFNFSGLGKHSNNKYQYFLSLNLFDDIVGDFSVWSAASVGKLSVTLRKRWPRKWPRLIANKKAKIGNMHVWMEMQEKIDSHLSGMSTVSNSPVTCRASEKLYCLATDTCKKPDSCAQCPGKNLPHAEEGLCTGMPTEKASLSFKDADMDQGEIGGELKITKAKNEFDIDAYEVYWGKDDKQKLENKDGAGLMLGKALPTGGDTDLKVAMNTPVPEGATHLLVFSKNAHGEYATPGQVIIRDAVLPKGKPSGLTFTDLDNDKSEISGTVTISPPADQTHLAEYALHWGKNDRRKISSGSFIKDVMKQADKDATHHLSMNTKIPDGATHLLVYSKNEHGEHPQPASTKIVDATRPCTATNDADCPGQVVVSADNDPEPGRAHMTVGFTRAQQEDRLTVYSVYWGRKDCAAGGQSGAKNGHIKDIPVGEKTELEIPSDTQVPAGSSYILVFAKSLRGESDNCVAAPFQDAGAPAKDQKAEL